MVLTNGDNGSYVHETLTCAWFRAEFGKPAPERAPAPRKRLNRVIAWIEWLSETGGGAPEKTRPLMKP